MQNPFYIDPTAGHNPNAMRGLGQALQGYGERKRADEAQANQNQNIQKAVDLYRSGDRAGAAEFMIANKDIGEQLKTAFGAQDQHERAITAKGLQRVLMGEDHRKVASDVIAKKKELGFPTVETEKFLNMTSEEAMERAEERMMFESPDKWKLWNERKGGGDKPVVVGKGGALVSSTGEELYRSPTDQDKPVGVIPAGLIKGLDADIAEQVGAAYEAAGGGADGVKAAREQRLIAQEDKRRAEVSGTLATKYPNANEQEMAQMQAALDSAPSVEAGLVAAETMRGKQITNVKAADMSSRALDLINNIIDNPELEDIVGSYEGKEESWIPFVDKQYRSDAEAEAIADIEELTNIVTVPNMDLMAGILSESDLRLLKTIAGGGLSRMRSIERFRKDAGKMQSALKKAVTVSAFTPRDREAYKWATSQANKGKPDARAILKKLGLPNG